MKSFKIMLPRIFFFRSFHSLGFCFMKKVSSSFIFFVLLILGGIEVGFGFGSSVCANWAGGVFLLSYNGIGRFGH